MVVAAWHGHHMQHIPASRKDCSTVVGALVTAGRVAFLLPVSIIRDDLSHIAIL